jgi:hypothetical protein
MDNCRRVMYLFVVRCARNCVSFTSLTTAVLLCTLFASGALCAEDRVVFSIYARIQFSVPSDWLVISSKSDAVNTVFAFQISNPAEEGTPDSTNLVIVASDLKQPGAKTAFEKKASNPEQKAQKRKLADHWGCSSFSATQGSTEYKIWDCFRTVTDCGVYVRAAWPHLPKNAPEYDRTMETRLAEILNSVAPFVK